MSVESRKAWVLDASVLINLLAGGRIREVLGGISASWCVVEQAANEVLRDPLDPRNEAPLDAYLKNNPLSVVELHGPPLETFIALVSAPGSDSLDDGEAATLAYAHHVGGVAVIDEKKARGISAKQFIDLPVLSTVDLYRHPNVLKILGEHALTQAILASLRISRMRVPPEHDDWVRSMIGHEEARQCSSLKRRQ